jgi:hypothetical protein
VASSREMHAPGHQASGIKNFLVAEEKGWNRRSCAKRGSASVSV